MINLGNENIQQINLGSEEIWDIYLGDDHVYEKTGIKLFLNDLGYVSRVITSKKLLQDTIITSSLLSPYVYKLVRCDTGNHATKIGIRSFFSSFLFDLIIGSNISLIEKGITSHCYCLESINVDVNNIYYDSRDNCNAIIETVTNKLITGCKNTVIPNTIVRIDDYAFEGCNGIGGNFGPGLTSISIPNSVTSIGYGAFSDCQDLKTVVMSNSIQVIEATVFWHCNSLTSINLSSNLTYISGQLFDGCTSLSSIAIPANVTSIGGSSFRSCIGLQSITIPANVTSIESRAFENCTNLNNITLKSLTPPSLGDIDPFSNTNNCPIYVPSSVVNTYKTAPGWSYYADRIVADPDN